MNNLLKKYLDGKITPQEVQELKNLPESVLFDAMKEDWGVYAEPLLNKRNNIWEKILWCGAAAILILLFGSTIMLWNHANTLSSQDIVVTTRGNGERANVTLPDGSTVILNSNSSLSYKPEDFTGNRRSVIFEGEGFFTISKTKGGEFTVHTSLVDVIVKGTTFNLLSRDKERLASLYLETGKVELRAAESGKCIEMKPGDFVQLDTTGKDFMRDSNANGISSSSWRSGEYIFINRSLKDVVKYLEYNSGTTLSWEATEPEDIYFTGTLPAGDLLEALEILRLSCGLKIQQTDDKIVLSTK